MNIFSRLKARYTWKWIGTVEGPTDLVDDDNYVVPGGNRRCYWVLYERGDGKRKYERVGHNWGSALALSRESQVLAWHVGGPLPTIEPEFTPKAAGRPVLVLLQGGKGAQ